MIAHPMSIHTDRFYQSIAKQFCPILYLHSDEQYFPCTIEYVISHCRLIYTDITSHQSTDLYHNISITDTQQRLDILSTCCTGNTNKDQHRQYRIHVAPHTRGGYLPQSLTLHPDTTQHNNAIGLYDTTNGHTNHHIVRTLDYAPIYVQIRTADIDTRIYIDIVYHIYCAYNGPLVLFGHAISRSAHDSDYEHITVRINISDMNSPCIYAVYLSQHGDNDGEWLLANKLQYEYDHLTQYQHPVIYSSRYGHSNHSRSGTYIVGSGIANEYCNKGYRWSPASNIIMLTHNPDIHSVRWLFYHGLYAPCGIDSLQCKSYWSHSEPMKSNGLLRRVIFGNRLNHRYLFNNTLK